MRYLQIINQASKVELGVHVGVAEWWWQRLRGLLGRPALGLGEGLLLTPCRAIHMAGMKYSLDVVFLDRQGAVVAMYPDIAPGSRTRWHATARSALELPSGTLKASSTQIGDTLVCSPAHGALLGGPLKARLEQRTIPHTESVLRVNPAEHSAV